MAIRNINKAFWLPAALWLLVQAASWYTYGIGLTNEAEKYIGQAHHLQDGDGLDSSKYIFYFIPIFLIFISLILRLGFTFVVVVQLLVNAMATIAFFKTVETIFKDTRKSLLATCVLITFLPLQYWNTFLYTESIFYSLCIFFMYSCIVLPAGKTSTHIARAAIMAAILFTRPLSILFLPAIAFFYLAQAKLSRVVKLLIAAASLLLVYMVITIVYTAGADMDILMPQIQGTIICFGPTAYTQANLQSISSGNPVNDLVYFIFHNPVYFSKLAYSRALSFFNLHRWQYSRLHNAYLACCMVLFYGFALVSIIWSALKKQAAFRYFFLPLVIIFCAGVMLQCDDYNNRFSMPLFPWIILLATDGFYTAVGRVYKQKNL